MRIGVLGSTGKMGQAVVQACERMNIPFAAHARSLQGNKQDVFRSADVIIDFSSHVDALENIKLAEDYAKPLIIATTAHEDLGKLVSSKIPLLYAPNTCLEWNIIKNAVNKLIECNPDLILTVDDIHSSMKKDAPSGTAKDLVKDIQNASIRSLRRVNLASWHRMSLYDTEQVMHLEHQVLNRDVYAVGAIKLAQKLILISPGTYNVDELLNATHNLS